MYIRYLGFFPPLFFIIKNSSFQLDKTSLLVVKTHQNIFLCVVTFFLTGLHAVIKCQSVAGDPPPCCYLCQPCSLKVLKSDIIHHLISPLHQISYIVSCGLMFSVLFRSRDRM